MLIHIRNSCKVHANGSEYKGLHVLEEIEKKLAKTHHHTTLDDNSLQYLIDNSEVDAKYVDFLIPIA